jgi:deoxyuridine 5'-triphosphate nucleotidohydrolase
VFSKNCKFCYKVVEVEQSFSDGYCDDCRLEYGTNGYGYHVKQRYQPITMMLWASLPQYQVLTDSTIDGVVDAQGNQLVFDYVIPECRLAIDVISEDQMLHSSELDLGHTKRAAADASREHGTREANYRWLVLPDAPGEARGKLLESINEIYVKEMDGKTHILTPRLQGDAGWDLVCDQDTECPPGMGTDIPSQVYLEIPNHLYAIVQARSSTSKKRLLVLPGVIDPAYRGQIFTMTFNPTTETVMVRKGDRISQLLFFYRIPHLHVNPVYDLRKSERGSRGFGSTG